MRYFLKLLATIPFMMILCSCGAGDHSSPEDVVEQFFTAVSKMDRDLLSDCFTEDCEGHHCQELRNKEINEVNFEQLKGVFEDAKIVDVEMVGEEEAIVTIEIPSKEKEDQFRTVRIDGKWYIQSI